MNIFSKVFDFESALDTIYGSVKRVDILLNGQRVQKIPYPLEGDIVFLVIVYDIGDGELIEKIYK